LIGQYRGKANLHGSDSVVLGPADVEANTYTGSKSEWVVMANAYVDLGTWWCITPFIGAGVGGSYNKLSGFQDNGVRYTAGALSNSVTYFGDNGKWNFAYAAHAGLAYKVNPGFTVELAYSYMNLGDAAPGNFRAFDNSISGPSTIKIKDITSHDVKLGVRWELSSPPTYMPPLVTKG
jgi:opacity protein-like surface antigen